jgi:hypothetical protein
VPKAVLDYSESATFKVFEHLILIELIIIWPWTGREPGVVITHGYFDDTIARVMDKLEYAEYKVSVGNKSTSDSSSPTEN